MLKRHPLSADRRREIELKLDIEPADVNRLVRCAWWKELQIGPARDDLLNATYFDTPERHLAKRGISVRVRREGARFVQCVKAKDRAVGTLDRLEWETPVRDGKLDRSSLAGDPVLVRLIPAAQRDALVPIFGVQVKRSRRKLRMTDGTVIACDLDAGKITAGKRMLNFREMELELISGTASKLFELTRRIIDTVPVRLGGRSKSERGFALLDGAAAEWRKAPRVHLPHDASAEDVLAAALGRCIVHMAGNEDCVLADAHPEGVHQMRVALRRLRAVLGAYRKLLPAEQYARHAGSAKVVLDALGPARDWDVFLVDVLGPVRKENPNNFGLKRLQRAVEEVRAGGQAGAEAMVGSAIYTEFRLGLTAWLHGRNWRQQPPSKELALLLGAGTLFAHRVLAKRHAKLVEAAKHVDHMSAEERHQLRIAIKKQRYASEVFAGLYAGGHTKIYEARLVELQDSLGYLNDVEVARRLLDDLLGSVSTRRRAGMAEAAKSVLAWHEAKAKAHNMDLAPALRRLAISQPYWEAPTPAV